MKEEIQRIFELAQRDLKIHALLVDRESLQQAQAGLDQSLAAKRVELETKTGQFKGVEKKRIDAEGEVQLTTSRVKEFEGKLNQIKTNKEYQAALKEVAQLRKEIKDKEDVVLQAMTELEALKKDVDTLSTESQAQEIEIGKQRQEIILQERDLAQKLETLQQERAQLLPLIDAPLLSQYERIRRHRPQAVAMVEQGACQGCYVRIPPQMLNEIRKGLVVHPCPSCSRLLFMVETPSAKEAV